MVNEEVKLSLLQMTRYNILKKPLRFHHKTPALINELSKGSWYKINT